MYPNFENKQDRSSKRQALLASIQRDQRLDAMKRDAYANALWASDSDDNKLKDATETGDTLSRILSAMKASSISSDKKGPDGPFSSVGDLYDEMSKEVPDVPSSTDEPMLEEKPDKPDNSDLYRNDIVRIFESHPELSNYIFNPIIRKDDTEAIVDTNFKLVHPDASLIKADGSRVNRNNQIYQSIDWELTEKSINDKVSSLMSKGSLLVDLHDTINQPKNRIRALFNQWKASTDAMGPSARSQLVAGDDQTMDDMSVAQRLDFEEWLGKREADPEMMDIVDEARKRPLEDSTVSLDPRTVKKSAEHTNMTKRGSVEYLFNNIDGLDQMQIRPYIKSNGKVKQTATAYLGPGMKVYNTKDGSERSNQTRANKQIDWDTTLNLVLGELSTGARTLNQQAGAEKDAKEQAMKYLRVKHIIDTISIVDPKQGKSEGELLAFEDKAFETPAQKGMAAPNITAAKKDFVYEPATGKGLTGRGLRGAGAPVVKKKSKAYNLADIEGSGKASDLKYKRLGTKFIRKADLEDNRLKLVWPNRTAVGPIRSMSDELTQMVKDLLYNDNISQQAYRALSVEDQRVFYEIVKKTHIQHTLQTPMIDPRITLKSEFDKLRGEIALGNNNPDMLRELHTLSMDMYEQKLITNAEFRSIMNALI
ncbi:hypothetical protein PHYPSEUDO_014216 [Phytophthora pseudosyringae]|uniref:Uncharacterized protein n=1 Tax=Phytophthora pseudosyringae TaxID=221518 RepID=A0A8T1V7T3_9STRA|nr:hypothetical protein PHYPSEUDO_014216 [Phytophthora pseudosyringae]